jgi:ankyrin repeat protein
MENMDDSESYFAVLMIDGSVRSSIQLIYSFLRSKKTITELNIALKKLHDNLLLYYLETYSALETNEVQRLANRSFSELLQYFFHYLLCSQLDDVYVNRVLVSMMTHHSTYFYYSETLANENKVILWIDPIMKETALTEVARKADLEVFSLLLDQLRLAFKLSQTPASLPGGFESYLFHENKLGDSALSLVWSRNRVDLEVYLLNMVKLCYGSKETLGFRRFTFQEDVKGDSLLMRSVQRGNKQLVLAIFDGINRFYGDTSREALVHLFIHQNKKGETALYQAIKNDQLAYLLINQGVSLFGTETQSFKRFLLLADEQGVNPFLLACKKGDKKSVQLFFSFFEKNTPDPLDAVRSLMSYQDQAGYTGLMRAIEGGHVESICYLLNILSNLDFFYSQKIKYEADVLTIFQLKTAAGESSMQLAARLKQWKILGYLIDYSVTFSESFYVGQLNYARDSEANVLTQLYHEEQAFRMQLIRESREPTAMESKASFRREKLAKRLFRAGLRSAELGDMPIWSFTKTSSARPASFSSIFCGSSPSRSKRSLSLACASPDREVRISIPEDVTRLYKEALVSIVANLQASNLDSIEQVSIIRHGNLISDREQIQLNLFRQAVDDYYQAHSANLLNRLKAVTASNLEAAFIVDAPYVLVDSGNNLLLLSQDTIFCPSLLNASKFFSLKSGTTHSDLKAWLDSYFSSQYTLHPFDSKLLNNYPRVFSGLEPIISDRTLLDKPYEGVKGSTIKRLFLLDNALMDLSQLTKAGFFTHYATKLSFRVENFHEVFFLLPVSEKFALKQLFGQYTISIAQHPHLSAEENEYLSIYGSSLIEFIKKSSDTASVTPLALLDLSILAHEALLKYETDLRSTEKKQLIDSFHALKNSLISNEKLINHGKAALQLLVLLLPNAIRAIATKNPKELAIPVGLMAADAILREFLTRLMNHPQAVQIFSGSVAGKVVGLIGKAGNRVPMIGSALAVYGLIQSGRALINTDHNDPNRSYYAHLLLNNVATLGVMGAEAVASLSFFPALVLFAALTTDQIIAEGKEVHDQVLHLKDDADHPLARWYTELKLGLSIVDASIERIQEQRLLFRGFLNYLNQIELEKEADAIVAITLPAAQSNKDSMQGNQTCHSSQVAANPAGTGPNASCDSYLVADKKEDYVFELGILRNVCERSDPFYQEVNLSNYTLLAGTLSLGCELGKAVETDAIAQVSSQNAAAGLLINQRYTGNNVTGDENYSVLLPIDPYQVANFVFVLRNDTAPNSPLNQGLSCPKNVVGCISKVRVFIAPFYQVAVHDRSKKTQVLIHDATYQAVNANNHDKKTIQSVEYLISSSDQLSISFNAIPEQTFAFFNQAHHFQWCNDSLQSETGFQASLQAIKKLTLELTDKATLSGKFTALAEQQLIINHLKGESELNLARLNTTHCKLFTVTLGRYTQLIDRSLTLTTLGNFTAPILGVSRHDKNQAAFYHLAKAINYFSVSSKQNETFILSVRDEAKKEFGKISLSLEGTENGPVIFSGNYKLENKTFFSRIFISKTTDLGWDCSLEINISTTNSSQQFDLSNLEKKAFNKVSLLTQDLGSQKTIHYIFCQNQALPKLIGKFTEYRLIAWKEGWLLCLKHKQINEETHVFLAEVISKLIINNIRYLVKPELAALFAMNTVDQSPIAGKDLIAPVKIDSFFSETNISFENKTYSIGNISLMNTPARQTIYFEDQRFPLVYLQYKSLLKLNRRTRRLAEFSTNYLHRPHWQIEAYSISSAASKPMGIIQTSLEKISHFFTSKVKHATRSKDKPQDTAQEKAEAYYDLYDRRKERSYFKKFKPKPKKILSAQKKREDRSKYVLQTVLGENKSNNPTLSEKLLTKPMRVIQACRIKKQTSCIQQNKNLRVFREKSACDDGGKNTDLSRNGLSQCGTYLSEGVSSKRNQSLNLQRIEKLRLSYSFHQSERQTMKPGIACVTASSDVYSTLFFCKFLVRCFNRVEYKPAFTKPSSLAWNKIENPFKFAVQKTVEKGTSSRH